MSPLDRKNLYQTVLDEAQVRRQQADTQLAAQIKRIEQKQLAHTHGTQREQEHAATPQRGPRAQR